MSISQAMLAVCALVAGLLAGMASAAVNIETVSVGNPGNIGDTRYQDTGSGKYSFGSVGYAYNIGKYEVTSEEYCEFLNAVAKIDAYGLYSSAMSWTNYGCKIRQSGSGTDADPFIYSVASGFGRRPVHNVSFWDACRFANWLHNGQPIGAQGVGTTETGAYTLNSYNGIDGRTIQRNPGARWAVPTEDEWYKAAYYKRSSTDSGYWDYPTSSDTINTGMANYNTLIGHTTDVGSYAYPSPYGTFDQGGNVYEWNEAVRYGSYRGFRGGTFNGYGQDLYFSAHSDTSPDHEGFNFGFRVVQVPDPTTLMLLALGGFEMLRRKRS